LLVVIFSAQTLADSQLRSSSVWQLDNLQLSSVFTINKADTTQLLEAVNNKQAEFISSQQINKELSSQISNEMVNTYWKF